MRTIPPPSPPRAPLVLVTHNPKNVNENGKYGVKTWSQVVFLKRVAHLDGAHADLKKQVEAEYIALDLLLPFTFLGLI